MFDINRVPEELRGSYDLQNCMEMVNDDPETLQHIFIQTEKMCIEGVSISGMCLDFVHEQTEAICLAAVRQDGLALQFVDIQTEEICIEAIKNNTGAIKYVNKQTKNIVMVYLEESLKERGEMSAAILEFVDYTILSDEDYEELALKYIV